MPAFRRFPGGPLVRTAAYGGGGAGLLGALSYALLALESRLARRAVPDLSGAPLADGNYGGPDGVPLRLALLGDSGAAGLGADQPADTPGALLAADLAASSGRPVILDVLAVTGSCSRDLDAQVARAILTPPHLAVIMVGANDIIHWVPVRQAAGQLALAVERLHAAGARVVVGTCPDLGALPFVPQPLRALAGWRSGNLAAAQQAVVEAAGGVAVPLAAQLRSAFTGNRSMLCSDGFHPSAAGYRVVAGALSPAVRTSAGGASVTAPS